MSGHCQGYRSHRLPSRTPAQPSTGSHGFEACILQDFRVNDHRPVEACSNDAITNDCAGATGWTQINNNNRPSNNLEHAEPERTQFGPTSSRIHGIGMSNHDQHVNLPFDDQNVGWDPTAVVLVPEEQCGLSSHELANPDAPDTTLHDEDIHLDSTHLPINPCTSAVGARLAATTPHHAGTSATNRYPTYDSEQVAFVRMSDVQLIDVDSWSPFNPRNCHIRMATVSREETNNMYMSSLPSSAEYNESSIPENDPATSRTTFDNDIDYITDPTSAIGDNAHAFYQMQLTTHSDVYARVSESLTPLPSRQVEIAGSFRIHLREGTPVQASGGDDQVSHVGPSE